MTNVKWKICAIFILILLMSTVLLTMSACNVSKLRDGIEVHKDGVYYTVYVTRRYAVARGFDRKDGVQVYEIPSRVKYKGFKFTVSAFLPSNSTGYSIVYGGEATELIVPETVETLRLNMFYGQAGLQKITVSENNPYYTSVNGVVYSKDKSELIYYPPAKVDNTLVIARQTSEISDNLMGKSKLSAIIVEEGNTTYSAKDGVLFTADGKEMVCYPRNKTDETYVIPQNWSVLNTTYFEHNQHLKYLEVEEGNTVFSAYKGDLYSADGSILLYRQNYDGNNVLELQDSITTISCGLLDKVRYLYVPKGLQKIVFEAHKQNGDVNFNNPIGYVDYVYFESDDLPFCLRYVPFRGAVKFGVTREQFLAEVDESTSQGEQL